MENRKPRHHEVQTRLMLSGVVDARELQRLVGVELGREASLKTCRNGLSCFRRHGADWHEVERQRCRTPEYRESHRERCRELRSTPEGREKRRQRRRTPEYREGNRERCSERYATDPNFRLACCLRRRVRRLVSGGSRSARTMELVGCSLAGLWLHLERQFQPGMSRGNYGEWHVDHVRPCASFDLTDPAQQRACFHFSNLRPLWGPENASKGSLWDGRRWSAGRPVGADAPGPDGGPP
jgi:hypothetical protein